MTARETFNASVLAASATKAATLATAELTRQTTIDGSLSVVGYNLQSGSYANLAAAVASANAAKLASLYAAEQAKQAAIALARDTLRNAGGDLAPF